MEVTWNESMASGVGQAELLVKKPDPGNVVADARGRLELWHVRWVM